MRGARTGAPPTSRPAGEHSARHGLAFLADGTDVGEAPYAVVIKPDEIIHVAGGGRMRVLDLVPVPEPDSPLTGFLKVEPA